jgi:hypothetical protein
LLFFSVLVFADCSFLGVRIVLQVVVVLQMVLELMDMVVVAAAAAIIKQVQQHGINHRLMPKHQPQLMDKLPMVSGTNITNSTMDTRAVISDLVI